MRQHRHIVTHNSQPLSHLIARYALPFFLLLMVAVVLVTAFPDIVTWLPDQMTRG
jgi:TRAP-type C4-dicarboxylate transport system permease large subunit